MEALSQGDPKNPTRSSPPKGREFQTLLKEGTTNTLWEKRAHSKSSAHTTDGSSRAEVGLASPIELTGQATAPALATAGSQHLVPSPARASEREKKTPSSIVEASFGVGSLRLGRLPAGGLHRGRSTNGAVARAISQPNFLTAEKEPSIQPVTAAPLDSMRKTAMAGRVAKFGSNGLRTVFRTSVKGSSDPAPGARLPSRTMPPALQSGGEGESTMASTQGDAQRLGLKPISVPVLARPGSDRTQIRSAAALPQVKAQSPLDSLVPNRTPTREGTAAALVKAKLPTTGASALSVEETQPSPTIGLVSPTRAAQATHGRLASSSGPAPAKTEAPSNPQLTAGWKIEPTQVDDRGGVRQSTWNIKPPLSTGSAMRMELTQEGSTLKANLTVSPAALGYLDLAATALPHHAVHLPQGVATLELTVTTSGGGGAGSQSNPEPRQAVLASSVAKSRDFQLQAGGAALASYSLAGLDYRA
ncbi:MAG: hypothetical protein C7B45_03255 [Sulfobacillus acidophilus]|uniref:Uncharacterized protein n=1 Tax=Sulfobacillus acidophilus TaxID=53633 RepID=A0A2T2WM80_9FIRM|nr:MAG: hypothetical protein C7B45_03255 [Sulfobacillus acidophilus]